MKATLIALLALGLTTGVALADDASGGSKQNTTKQGQVPGQSDGTVTTGTTTAPAGSGAAGVKCDEAAGSEEAKAACNNQPGVDTPSASTTPGNQQAPAGGATPGGNNESGTTN